MKPVGTRNFGGLFAESTNTELQPYMYNGKELDRTYGLDWHDYGARHYDAALLRWHTMDPLSEKYNDLSPYAMCGDNPVNYVDPNGMKIEDSSQDEWNKLKANVENVRDKLQRQIDKLNRKSQTKKWSTKKLSRKIGNKAERVASLNTSLTTMGILEGSSQVYALKHTSEGQDGGISLDPSSHIISIEFGSTANFVHEMTHAGQFESGEIGFIGSNSVLQDLYDEVIAYQAQFAYSPFSVSAIKSSSRATQNSHITAQWVQKIVNSKGMTPYAYGGTNNTGILPVNMQSSRLTLINAYPWLNLFQLPQNFTAQMINNIYYK